MMTMKHEPLSLSIRSAPLSLGRSTLQFICIALLLSPLSAWAESGGHGGAHGTMIDLKWPAINFTLYVVGMFFLLRGIISSGWTARSERIAAQASKGERELEAAAALLTAARERQTKLPTEKASIGRVLASEAQAESAKILEDAAERAKEIERHAANRISAEQQAAIQSTRRRIAEKVVASAETKIRSGISHDTDRRLRENTARSMSGLKVS